MWNLLDHRSVKISLLTIIAIFGIGSAGSAHEGHRGLTRSQPSGPAPAASYSERELRDESFPLESRPPHRGQVTRGLYHSFEVVYQPQETRIYVYGPTQRPVTARGVEGQVTMQVRGNPTVFSYPVRYVPPTGSESKDDYLSIPVDVRQVRDGDMRVTFDLVRLPYSQQEPQVRFAQIFALTRTPVVVAVAPITQADFPGIAQQQVCPVMGTPLGEHGEVVKLMVGDQPLYLCCQDCIEKVRQNPDFYVRQAAGAASPAPQTQGTVPSITVTPASDADREAIAAQRICPVMNKPLGGHGTPLKVTVNGQSLYICCRGCLRKVTENPELYLSRAAQLRGEG